VKQNFFIIIQHLVLALIIADKLIAICFYEKEKIRRRRIQ